MLSMQSRKLVMEPRHFAKSMCAELLNKNLPVDNLYTSILVDR